MIFFLIKKTILSHEQIIRQEIVFPRVRIDRGIQASDTASSQYICISLPWWESFCEKKRRSIAIEMKNILNINRYKNIFILRIHCIGYFLFHVICRVNSKYCNMHSFYHESISQTVYFYINMNAPMSYSH